MKYMELIHMNLALGYVIQFAPTSEGCAFFVMIAGHHGGSLETVLQRFGASAERCLDQVSQADLAALPLPH